MTCYSTAQFAKIAGRSTRTVREHIKKGYLKAAEVPGARGLRITHTNAIKWLEVHQSDKLPK